MASRLTNIRVSATILLSPEQMADLEAYGKAQGYGRTFDGKPVTGKALVRKVLEMGIYGAMARAEDWAASERERAAKEGQS